LTTRADRNQSQRQKTHSPGTSLNTVREADKHGYELGPVVYDGPKYILHTNGGHRQGSGSCNMTFPRRKNSVCFEISWNPDRCAIYQLNGPCPVLLQGGLVIFCRLHRRRAVNPLLPGITLPLVIRTKCVLAFHTAGIRRFIANVVDFNFRYSSSAGSGILPS